MRKTMRLALAAVVALSALSFATAQAHAGCTDTLTLHHKHTAAGSCKNPSAGWNIVCGTANQITNVVFHVYASVVGTDGFEVEACSDTGNGDTQGRLMLIGSAAGQGVRAILDSDPDQAFPAGYIVAQLNPSKPGVWCPPKTGPNSTGDGYQQPWNNPGPVGGLNADALTCAPSPGASAQYRDMFDAAASIFVKQMPQFASQVSALRTMLF